MKNIKALLSALIAASVVLSLAACTKADTEKEKNDNKETKAAEETTVAESDDFPLMLDENLNYGGREVRILVELGVGNAAVSNEITVEGLKNETVNDTVYNRELYIEELLGVDIKTVKPEVGVLCAAYIERMHNAGEVPAEIVTGYCENIVSTAQNGYYYDMNSIENLNLGSVWWSQDFISEASVGDKLYFATGDAALSLLRSIYVTLFNKKIAADNNIENVYETVFAGKWTIDKMTELASGIYVDVNGNSEKDEEDIYGFLSTAMATDPLWSALDIDVVSKDEDGYFVYNSPLEKFGTAHDKVLALFNAKTSYGQGVWWNTEFVQAPFASDRGLFAISEMVAVESSTLRNMQSEYGILPIPKFDEAQDGYYTMPHDAFTVFGIMANVPEEDADMAGAVLEAMGWYSRRYLTPAYLDVAMKGKYANDAETRKMLDIIVAGEKMDAAWIYANCFSGYPQEWRSLVFNNDSNYTSAMTSKERNIKIQIKELNRVFSELGE